MDHRPQQVLRNAGVTFYAMTHYRRGVAQGHTSHGVFIFATNIKTLVFVLFLLFNKGTFNDIITGVAYTRRYHKTSGVKQVFGIF